MDEVRSPHTLPVGRISTLRLAIVLTFAVPAMTTEGALNSSVVIDPFSPTVILSRPLILPSTWPSMMAGPPKNTVPMISQPLARRESRRVADKG